MIYEASRRAENSPQRGEYRRSRTSYSFPTVQSAGRCQVDGEGGALYDVMPLGCPLANTRCGVEKIVVVASMDVLAGGNRIGCAKVFRDEGRGATTCYRPQVAPRFASGRSADRTSTMQNIAPATARYFRLCTALRRAI